MSNLNNLISKIIDDANEESLKLLEKARLEEKKIIEEKISMAEREKKVILEKAKTEAKTRGERVVSNAVLQVRNMKLDAKQKVLDKAFNLALEELMKLSDEKLLQFIKNDILSLNIDGDEEIIVKEGNSVITLDFINEINEALKAKGKKGQLKLSSEQRNIKGGYILSKNNIEINNTFEALVMSLRDELEGEVASALF